MMLAFSKLDFLLSAMEWLRVIWVMAFGACLGSLVNVLVYRIPLGLGVVTPPSRCPSCETVLTWRENIPIFGWLLLRGRCRFCRAPVSPEYPIIEAFVALLFGVTYVLLYGDGWVLFGHSITRWQAEWGGGGFSETWPLFVAVVVLWTCLVTSLLIDAKTYHIPIVLTWIPALVALAAHGGLALWMFGKGYWLTKVAPGWFWAIPTPGRSGWAWTGGSLGAMVGLAISNAAISFGWIKRSFADYDEWAQAAEADRKKEAAQGADGEAVITEPADGTVAGPSSAPEDEKSGAGSRDAESTPERVDTAAGEDPAHMWIQYPHARREMVRELVFLAPCIGLGLAGASLAIKLAGPWRYDAILDQWNATHGVPSWLRVIAAVFMGYLIGGGVVWLWRVVGSLAVGKEALGLGDVHLMAAVGACIGWVDSVLGFFAAAFVGVIWTLLGKLASGKLQRAMPFGPYLAVGTMLVWFLKPVVEKLLGALLRLGGPFELP